MWQLNSASGFYKAPVCKCILGASFLSSVLINFPLSQYRHLCVYHHSLIVEKLQLWRLLTARIAFLNVKDLMIGSILFYYFRTFERRYGSRKFASQLIGFFVFGSVLELSAVHVCKLMHFNMEPLPSGPLCLIYPFFVPYFMDIPRIELGNVLGIPMTGKSFQYFLGLQVASGSLETLIVAFCGIISGILWRKNFLKIQQLIVIPSVIAGTVYKVFGRFIDSAEPKDYVLPMGATLELQRQERMDQIERQVLLQSIREQGPPYNPNQNGPGLFGAMDDAEDFAEINEGLRQRNVPAADPPSQEQIQQLVDMGFTEESVRRALLMSHNDLNTATNFLLQES
ncbi:ubiquitin-associated domain-containing protein 2-like [Saccostrea echinata]|uniref:ubiquitin-associated domain-containing protein 2-like n=1 Tax=Saccostrea echinata TaxID=191078 RepID=UPI002A817B39|nr:ubiquitin-associated domain-containing protein 2-like [Saccostrea echinata]